MTVDAPRYFIGGVVIMPARIAEALERRFPDLHELRVGMRGRDPEFVAVLEALHFAALAYAEAVSRTGNAAARPSPRAAAERETEGSLAGVSGAASVAAELGVTKRRVNQLAAEGTLPAQRIEGRWLFNRRDIEDYRKRA